MKIIPIVVMKIKLGATWYGGNIKVIFGGTFVSGKRHLLFRK